MNDHIIGAAFCCHDEPQWLDVGKELQSDVPQRVALVNLNGPGDGEWKFSLWHNGEIVWERAGRTYQEYTLGHTQTLQLLPDMVIEEPPPRHGNTLEGTWNVRISAEAAGIITVNGIPVAGAYSGSGTDPTSPTGGLVDSGWVDISALLYREQENTISMSVWSRTGHYRWYLALKKDSEILWGNEDSGEGETGEVFFVTLRIDRDGILSH